MNAENQDTQFEDLAVQALHRGSYNSAEDLVQHIDSITADQALAVSYEYNSASS